MWPSTLGRPSGPCPAWPFYGVGGIRGAYRVQCSAPPPTWGSQGSEARPRTSSPWPPAARDPVLCSSIGRVPGLGGSVRCPFGAFLPEAVSALGPGREEPPLCDRPCSGRPGPQPVVCPWLCASFAGWAGASRSPRRRGADGCLGHPVGWTAGDTDCEARAPCGCGRPVVLLRDAARLRLAVAAWLVVVLVQGPLGSGLSHRHGGRQPILPGSSGWGRGWDPVATQCDVGRGPACPLSGKDGCGHTRPSSVPTPSSGRGSRLSPGPWLSHGSSSGTGPSPPGPPSIPLVPSCL